MARITGDKPAHAVELSALWETLGSSPEGLASAEAAERLRKLGPNELERKRRRSLLSVFAHQFQSPLIYLLFAAAVIAYAIGERRDAAVVLVVVALNSIIGTFQEGRAERSMEALRNLSQLRVRTLRDGDEQVIEARELVPGDVVLLAAGDAVAADVRLIEARRLEAAEAALTGESLPVPKRSATLADGTGLADRENLVFNGTHITSGRGLGVVVATGPDTEVGHIATLTQSARDPATPLELRIRRLGRYLVVAAALLFGVILLLGYARDFEFRQILMVAISQVVSMIPEGLPVAVTVALAVGMQRMAARGAVVRRLAAVETLGSTTVICTDKTGTLTRNEMTVVALVSADGRRVAVSGSGYAPDGEFSVGGEKIPVDASMTRLALCALLCNDADVRREEEGWKAVGDPTEASLVTLARKAGLEPDEVREHYPRACEVPFDSETKIMLTEHSIDGRPRTFVKGAPEAVLSRCGLSDAERESMLGTAHALATEALRVLAFAEYDGTVAEAQKGSLKLLGLMGQIDPPRQEAGEAVAACLAAGIRPIMVTGDHKATGLAVARMIGIAGKESIGVDGGELERMSDADLEQSMERISVFARVHPSQKLRIVRAFQRKGEVVAMTGDGVNDAPALATADVGVAMGITGTEVAKGAAKIVVSDDNFATIVHAVEEGRLIYGNLKKVIIYLFATSTAEILLLMSALVAGFPLPLTAVQILWINLVTDGAVTINLIMEPAEGDEMKRPPIPPREPILTRPMLRRLFVLSPAMWLSTLAWFVVRLDQGVAYPQAQTETFTLLAVNQWYNVLNCRSETRSAFTRDIFRNRWLVGGLAIGMAAQTAVVYWAPMNAVFHTAPLPLSSVIAIGIAATPVLWVEELRKWGVRRKMRRGDAATRRRGD